MSLVAFLDKIYLQWQDNIYPFLLGGSDVLSGQLCLELSIQLYPWLTSGAARRKICQEIYI